MKRRNDDQSSWCMMIMIIACKHRVVYFISGIKIRVPSLVCRWWLTFPQKSRLPSFIALSLLSNNKTVSTPKRKSKSGQPRNSSLVFVHFSRATSLHHYFSSLRICSVLQNALPFSFWTQKCRRRLTVMRGGLTQEMMCLKK